MNWDRFSYFKQQLHGNQGGCVSRFMGISIPISVSCGVLVGVIDGIFYSCLLLPCLPLWWMPF